MRNGYLLLFFACQLSCDNGIEPEKEVSAHLVVRNTLDWARTDVAISLTTQELSKEYGLKETKGIIPVSGGEVLDFQWNDIDKDGTPENLVFLINFDPGEKKEVHLKKLREEEENPEILKRTQAEISHKRNGFWEDRKYIGGDFENTDHLKLPPQHTDHSYFIRYEGPGWESDKVGYRFYLDWRNAIDVFGKRTNAMVLHEVGQDGFDSYHEMSDWGMDILKVGESLGIGSLGIWLDGKAQRIAETDSVICKILINGPIQSAVKTSYYGWKAGDNTVDVFSELSIHAGSRLTRHDVTFKEGLPNVCTGIGIDEKTLVFSNRESSGEWTYMATWGQQSLAGNLLGLAIIFRKEDLMEMTKDENSHVAVLKGPKDHLTYYLLAAWEEELGGITSREDFIVYLDKTVEELASTSLEIQPGGK